MKKKNNRSSLNKLKQFTNAALLITSSMMFTSGCAYYKDGLTTRIDEINTELFNSDHEFKKRVNSVTTGMSYDQVIKNLCEDKEEKVCQKIKDSMDVISPFEESQIYLAGINSTSASPDEIHELFESIYGLQIRFGQTHEKSGLTTSGLRTVNKGDIHQAYFIFDKKTNTLKTDPVYIKTNQNEQSESKYWKLFRKKAENAL